MKLDAYASVHAFKKALDNYNQCLHEYKPEVKALPHIFNSMVVIYNSIRKHAWDLIFAACLLKQMQCYACHDAPRLAIAMDGNFSLKRKKIATFTITAATTTTDEGVFEPCLREKQVYGTTAEVFEFEQESYVSKDECPIEELDSKFKVLNSQALAGLEHVLNTTPTDQKLTTVTKKVGFRWHYIERNGNYMYMVGSDRQILEIASYDISCRI